VGDGSAYGMLPRVIDAVAAAQQSKHCVSTQLPSSEQKHPLEDPRNPPIRESQTAIIIRSSDRQKTNASHPPPPGPGFSPPHFQSSGIPTRPPLRVPAPEIQPLHRSEPRERRG
jgi:hypothetical protein